jgi:hypothetical protein
MCRACPDAPAEQVEDDARGQVILNCLLVRLHILQQGRRHVALLLAACDGAFFEEGRVLPQSLDAVQHSAALVGGKGHCAAAAEFDLCLFLCSLRGRGQAVQLQHPLHLAQCFYLVRRRRDKGEH